MAVAIVAVVEGVVELKFLDPAVFPEDCGPIVSVCLPELSCPGLPSLAGLPAELAVGAFGAKTLSASCATPWPDPPESFPQF